jgi:pimeloyl-ACP methyl ester carboxylesterase
VTIERELVPGHPDLPPLVFLHEGLGSLGLWRDFPRRVANALGGPTTFVYSRAGYGYSSPVSLPRPITYMHEEALEVLPVLLHDAGIDRPVLIGHSDGASIAIISAGAGFPVESLVLISPHVIVEDRSIAGIETAAVAFESGDLRERLRRHHADVDVAFRGWNDVWRSSAFRDWDITSSLVSITCPVLMIQEERDAYGTLAQLDVIERGVSGPVTRLVLPGSGHSAHIDWPDEVTEAIVRHLS